MKNRWIKFTISCMFLTFVGVGTWAVIDRLDDTTLKVLVGVVFTLVIVVIVGGLFIGYGLIQGYIVRRMLAQDDLSDMRQMALIARLMGSNRPPNVNVRLPDQQGWPMLGAAQSQQPSFDGTYRDTTTNSEIEIE